MTTTTYRNRIEQLADLRRRDDERARWAAEAAERAARRAAALADGAALLAAAGYAADAPHDEINLLDLLNS